MPNKLPIGTRIKFTAYLGDGPTGDRPAVTYAERGQLGRITGHDAREGYQVVADNWPNWFGASTSEFVPVTEDGKSEKCPCQSWARDASNTFPRHHQLCPYYDPTDVLPAGISTYFARQPKGAVFSDCRTYRYLLWRVWDLSAGLVNYIGLNPSKADEKDDDHTIRRETSYAKQWGYGGFVKTNIFAYCSTDPKVLYDQFRPVKRRAKPLDIVGRANPLWIRAAALQADLVVPCWGNGGALGLRGAMVRREELKGFDLHVFGLTKQGEPKHPSRLPDGLKPVRWNYERRD